QERLHHLESQVRDMLIFARGEAPLHDDVSVEDLFVGLQAAMEVPLAQYHAQCDVRIDAPEARLMCNRDALISALMNLINNALESCQAPIVLAVCADVTANGLLRIRVIDNGPGLTAEQKTHMLEPFFTTKSNGTGLGLAVVQAVVRAHHGEFSLTDNEIAGVSANLLLPLARN
ncbi:MAG: HAMP domain-containing sensor histidine kinase, partial [Oleibacter sp.]|nr:HAMP domain-containing sensor histidine kinase [Thalassolituus sp.]